MKNAPTRLCEEMKALALLKLHAHPQLQYGFWSCLDLWSCCLGFSCKEILFPLHNISSCGSFKIRDHCSGVFLLVLYRCGNNTFPGIRWTVGWETQKIRQLLKVVTFCLCRHPLSFVCLWALPLSFEHDYWISLSCF